LTLRSPVVEKKGRKELPPIVKETPEWMKKAQKVQQNILVKRVRKIRFLIFIIQEETKMESIPVAKNEAPVGKKEPVVKKEAPKDKKEEEKTQNHNSKQPSGKPKLKV
jgi:hypothetical protein